MSSNSKLKLKKAILKVLMKEMAELTLPECRDVCIIPLSCCDKMYCEIALHYAKRTYNIELKPTSHPTLPFMSKSGCIVEPHMRPMCTVHTCAVQSIGWKINNNEWNETYWLLRNRIDDLLCEADQESRAF